MKNNHTRGKRGDVGGWSASATRRNTEFLYTIREKDLDGTGFAVTLTLKHCPPDSKAWHALRRAWDARMRRAGMIRMHWVTEWQRRGCPHMHCAIWWPDEMYAQHGMSRLRDKMVNDWVMLASEYGAGFKGQDAHLITGAVGWFQYVSKHAARGIRHYQRSSENVPEAWKLKTGRMWGKVGEWPVQPPLRINLEGSEGDGAFYAYRRMIRSWRVAACRASGDLRRLRYARAMLTCPDRARSSVRGFSEWVPQEVQLPLVANLAGRGYAIRYDDPTKPVPNWNPEQERQADDAWLDEALTEPE